MSAMFEGCSALRTINVSNFNTSKVTNMWYMFKDCSGLKTINVSNFNTSKVTDFCAMFDGCSSLTSIDVSKFNTSSATRLNSMFNGCSALTSIDLSSFNTTKVTGMAWMFGECKSLRTLDLSALNTVNVTTMNGMFNGCTGLTSLDLSPLDTKKVAEIGWMFKGCTELTSLDLSTFNTNNVTEMKYMFDGCKSLATIYVGELWNTNKVTSSSYMFRECTKLVGGAGTKYNAHHVDKEYAHIDGGSTNPGYLTDINDATGKLSLQEFIDSKAGATGTVIVDLSNFNDLMREQTLRVSTGTSYRFINGTLDKATTLGSENPVMTISGGSKVEIGSGAVVTSQGYNASETVRMEGGTLSVTQGIVEGSLYYPPGYIGNPGQSPAVRLTSPSDHFLLAGGSVYSTLACDAEGADIQLGSGMLMGMGLRETDSNAKTTGPRKATISGSRSPRITTRSDVYLNATKSKDYEWGVFVIIGPGSTTPTETYHPFHIALNGESILHLQRRYAEGFVFTLNEKHDGDIIAVGDGYTITQTDVDNMEVETLYRETTNGWEERDCRLELKDNRVYLRFEDEDTSDDDWLQRNLDAIAAKKPQTAVELVVPAEGITLRKSIQVSKDCKAIITGGPITSESEIDFRYGAEGLFMVYGEIGFRDIILDFKNDVKAKGNLGYFWMADGSVSLLDGSTLETANGTVTDGWGKLLVDGGHISAGGDAPVVSEAVDATINSGSISGKQTYWNGEINETTGKSTLLTGLSTLYVNSTLRLNAPRVKLPALYMEKDASIVARSGKFFLLFTNGDWSNMSIGHTLVASDDGSLMERDYRLMTFEGMPTNRRAAFDAGEHAVKLESCAISNMQNEMNHLTGKGSLTAPVALSVSPATTLVVSSALDTGGRHIAINGYQNGGNSRSRMHFNQDQTFTIDSGSSLTLTNVDVTGEGGSEHFVVSGTLIVGENVHASGFQMFAHLTPSGRLLMSGALACEISISLSNASIGQTVAEGHDGYRLTEDDLALLSVSGCELTLDAVNNRIIISGTSGIESVADPANHGRNAEEDAIYDLSGRKIRSTLRSAGVYIIRSNGKSRKISIK